MAERVGFEREQTYLADFGPKCGKIGSMIDSEVTDPNYWPPALSPKEEVFLLALFLGIPRWKK